MHLHESLNVDSKLLATLYGLLGGGRHLTVSGDTLTLLLLFFGQLETLTVPAP